MKESIQASREQFEGKLREVVGTTVPEELQDDFWEHYDIWREHIREEVFSNIRHARALNLGGGDPEKATIESVVRVRTADLMRRRSERINSAHHE